MELKNYLAILQRWGWVMVLCTLLAGITGYWYTSRQSPVYQSRSRYLIGPALDNPNVTSNDLRASSQIGQTYNELATSRPVLQAVIDTLQLPTTPDLLKNQISPSWIDTTQILSIRANATNPQVAADIANAIGDELIKRSPSSPTSRQATLRQDAKAQLARLQETITTIEQDINQLVVQVQQTSDQNAQRGLIVQLDQRRAQLATAQRSYTDLAALLQSSDVNQVSLVEAAVPVPNAPIAPEVSRTVLAATIAGVVLGLVAMILLEYFNDVIYTPETLREATGLTYLGNLVRRKPSRNAKTPWVMLNGADTPATESFRILRSNLQLTSNEQPSPTLLITSPARGDGKSDIAVNLAISLAQSGKRVILIDANLRNPQITSRFELSEQPGLAQLLDLQTIPAPISVPAINGLFIVPSGGTTVQSSEILGSPHIYRLLQEYKTLADAIIIDSPALSYADALALAPQVDGVLLVVSSGTTGREQTINAVGNLRLVGARMIGSVLNRVKTNPRVGYYKPLTTTASDHAAPLVFAAGNMHQLSRSTGSLTSNEQPTLQTTLEVPADQAEVNAPSAGSQAGSQEHTIDTRPDRPAQSYTKRPLKNNKP